MGRGDVLKKKTFLMFAKNETVYNDLEGGRGRTRRNEHSRNIVLC